jgi:hypothetical protein
LDKAAGQRARRVFGTHKLGVVSYGIFLWYFDWIEQLGDFGVTARRDRGFVVPVLLAVPLMLSCATARRLHVLAA